MNKWDLLSAIDYMSAEHDRSDLEIISKAITDRINSIFGAEVIGSSSDLTGYDGRTVSAQAIIERISQQMMNVLLRRQGATATAIAQPKMILTTEREPYTPAVTACPETQAALDRVEELKRRYTPEQIAEMRKLRAEVEEMVSQFETVDKDKNLTDEAKKQAKLALLSKYNIPKYRGKKLDGDPIEFVSRSDTYGRFIRAKVIFKADVRKMDKELVAIINQEVYRNGVVDPLMTEDQKTEMTAALIIGDEKQQQFSLAMILRREPHKKLQKMVLNYF